MLSLNVVHVKYTSLFIAGDNCLTECVTSALIGHRSIDNKIAASHFNFETTNYRSNAVSVNSEEEMFSNIVKHFPPEFGTVLICINNNQGSACMLYISHIHYVLFSSNVQLLLVVFKL